MSVCHSHQSMSYYDSDYDYDDSRSCSPDQEVLCYQFRRKKKTESTRKFPYCPSTKVKLADSPPSSPGKIRIIYRQVDQMDLASERRLSSGCSFAEAPSPDLSSIVSQKTSPLNVYPVIACRKSYLKTNPTRNLSTPSISKPVSPSPSEEISLKSPSTL